MSYRLADSKPVWHIPLLCVQWKTPDDGQRHCPKHVEFHSKNKFEKLVHIGGFIIRNLTRCTVTWTSDCHDARSRENQKPLNVCSTEVATCFRHNWPSSAIVRYGKYGEMYYVAVQFGRSDCILWDPTCSQLLQGWNVKLGNRQLNGSFLSFTSFRPYLYIGMSKCFKISA